MSLQCAVMPVSGVDPDPVTVRVLNDPVPCELSSPPTSRSGLLVQPRSTSCLLQPPAEQQRQQLVSRLLAGGTPHWQETERAPATRAPPTTEAALTGQSCPRGSTTPEAALTGQSCPPPVLHGSTTQAEPLSLELPLCRRRVSLSFLGVDSLIHCPPRVSAVRSNNPISST